MTVLIQEHVDFFRQMVKERKPVSTKRLKRLGSAQFPDVRFEKKYIVSCLKTSKDTGFVMENRGFDIGSGKFHHMLWVAK